MSNGLPFSSSGQSAGSTPWLGPEAQPDVTQGGAPGGLFPTDAELPVSSHDGGPPMTTNGFRPSPQTHPLPAPGSCDGDPLPPVLPRR